MPRPKPRDDALTFFLDECLKCSLICDALTAALLPEERLEVARKGTLDEEWLPRVGQAGWICLSKDRRLMTRPHELRAMIDFKVAVVMLGEASGKEHARLLVGALPVIRRAAHSLPRAFVLRVDAASDLSVLFENGEKLARARPMRRRADER